MPSNLQGLEITDIDSTVYNFEIFKQGDNQQRGVSIATKEWELGDPIDYWKEPLFPFDGGLRQDRLPRVASISKDHTRSRTYAKANIDASNEGVLVPPPSITTKTLNQISQEQVTFGNLQLFRCGRYIYSVNRSGTVALDKDFGVGNSAVTMVVFNNELIVGMGETVKIWSRTFSGTWTQASNSTFAIALGVVGNKLWRAESTNKMSNCITGPLTLANWTPASPNQYAAGDTTYAVNTIIDYGGVPVALKADGAYFPDSKSDFYNQAPQMVKWPHLDNGKGAFVAQGYLWVPTVIGLLRISPGESVILGPEKSNRPDFRFWVRGGVEWGESIYLLVTDETQQSETFICKMSKDKYGITQGQEYIYHEWCRLGSVDKGYSIGINAWPAPTVQSITRDAGTVSDLTGVGTITWASPTNAASSNDAYATAAAGTSHYLRFSNFGFALPTGSAIQGIRASLERKTSQGATSQADTPAGSVTLTSGTNGVNWVNQVAGSSNYATFTATSLAGFTGIMYFRDFVNFNIPSSATILGVTVEVSMKVEAAGTIPTMSDVYAYLMYNGSVRGYNRANPTPFSNKATTYGSSVDDWNATLTPAIINDDSFGFAYAANYNAPITNPTVTIGETLGVMQITVYFVLDGTVDSVVKLVNASGAVTGNNKASASEWSTSDATVTYGNATDNWGVTLTESLVEDVDFGFVLSVVTPSTITSSVDYGSLTLWYLESGGSSPPQLFATIGDDVKILALGFGAGRDIDDPNYQYGLSMEVESGLFQPVQDVTLISGLVGVSLVGKIRATDSVTLQYSLGADGSYTNLLTTQEGGGSAAIVGDATYNQFTRFALPNTTGPYFKFKLAGTLATGAGTDRCEIRVMWAFGYVRPKVTDLIKVPIYADRLAMFNGIPQGRSGGDNLRLFRAWKRDQTVLAVRLADYEESRTIRARIFDIEGEELVTEKDTDGQSREAIVANVILMRDDFAGAYGNT